MELTGEMKCEVVSLSLRCTLGLAAPHFSRLAQGPPQQEQHLRVLRIVAKFPDQSTSGDQGAA